jgi:predicted ester cyclase
MTRCTNSEPGTFNHECGRPAEFTGTHPSGHRQNFCAACRTNGHEARTVTRWQTIDQPAPLLIMGACA